MSQRKERPTTDEVIQETRGIKEALAQAMDFDIDHILEDAREKQQKSGRVILHPPVHQDA